MLKTTKTAILDILSILSPSWILSVTEKWMQRLAKCCLYHTLICTNHIYIIYNIYIHIDENMRYTYHKTTGKSCLFHITYKKQMLAIISTNKPWTVYIRPKLFLTCSPVKEIIVTQKCHKNICFVKNAYVLHWYYVNISIETFISRKSRRENDWFFVINARKWINILYFAANILDICGSPIESQWGSRKFPG